MTLSGTGILGVLGAAVLFVLFGWLTRSRRLGCGRDGEACETAGTGCVGCPANLERAEAKHGRS